MSVGRGILSKIQFAEEASFGTFNSAATPYNLAINSETLGQNINTIESQLIRSDRRVPSIRGGNKSSGGDITTEAQPNAHVLFWKHFLADAATTGAASATAHSNGAAVEAAEIVSATGPLYYIVIQPGALGASAPTHNTLGEVQDNGTATLMYIGSSLTAWKNHVLVGNTAFPTGGLCVEKLVDRGAATSYFRYVGGRVNQLSLSIPQEGIVSFVASLLFLQQASFDETVGNGFNDAGTTVNDEVFAGYDTSLELSVGAADSFSIVPYISQMNLQLQNEFDENVFAIPGRIRRDLVEGRRRVTGSATLWFESLDEFTYFNNETVLDLKIGLANVNGGINIRLPQVKFTGGNPTPQISGPGALSTSVNFNAFYNGGGAVTEDIQVTINNTTATI